MQTHKILLLTSLMTQKTYILLEPHEDGLFSMNIILLKKELKKWEHDFIKKYNRSPKKSDIDQFPAIKLKYKSYSKYKSKKIRNERTPIKNNYLVDDTTVGKFPNISGNNEEDFNELINEEFGPTPQIYGKSIGLFEINLSPIKKKLDLIEVDEDDDALEESNIDKVENLLENNRVPITKNDDKSNNHKDLRNEISTRAYGPNSPLKIESTIRYRQRTPRRNLNIELSENVTPVGISPSPLWKRSLTKSLKELEHEFQTVRKELKLTEIEEETEEEEEEEDNEDNDENMLQDSDVEEKKEISNTNDKRVNYVEEINTEALSNNIFTNSRTQRRRKNRVMVKVDTTTNGALNSNINKEVDLHAMLRNIKRQKLKEFIEKKSIPLPPTINDKLLLEDVRLNKETVEDTDRRQDTAKAPVKQKRKKKYNLVSNNFRKLKLPNRNKRNNHWRKYSHRKF